MVIYVAGVDIAYEGWVCERYFAKEEDAIAYVKELEDNNNAWLSSGINSAFHQEITVHE